MTVMEKSGSPHDLDVTVMEKSPAGISDGTDRVLGPHDLDVTVMEKSGSLHDLDVCDGKESRQDFGRRSPCAGPGLFMLDTKPYPDLTSRFTVTQPER